MTSLHTDPCTASIRRYHHGNLRQALLKAAEQILQEQGIQGLKLRAIAKRAGVSHTAADPHFGDLSGLLSELAAIGFERLCAAMAGGAKPEPSAPRIARGYIGFAIDNPQLFLLMFRSEVLTMTLPRLRDASHEAFLALAAAASRSASEPDRADDPGSCTLTLEAAARLTAAWGIVHGIAMLAITDHLRPLLERVQPAPLVTDWIDAALSAFSFSAPARSHEAEDSGR